MTNPSRVASRVDRLFSSHSQTTNTLHPSEMRVDMFFASRVLFFSILSPQNTAFVLGSTKNEHPSCPCQKQPLTKTTLLYLGKTMSGLPGRRLSLVRYRSPFLNKKRLTSNSALVSLPLMERMILLRCAGEKRSAIEEE